MSAMSDASPLRRSVLVAIVGVAALAVAMFAVPLAVAVQRLYRAEATLTLERDANRISAAIPFRVARRPGSVPLPRGTSSRLNVGIYDLTGRRIRGRGPLWSPVAEQASDGGVDEAVEHGMLAVSAPMISDEARSASVRRKGAAGRPGPVAQEGTAGRPGPVDQGGTAGRSTLVGQTSPSGRSAAQAVPIAVIRVAMPGEVIDERIERAWLLMAGLGVLVVALAAVVAARNARRLAAPLELLTRDAQALGDGDFTIRARRVGAREADAASEALEATARRLGQTLDRERAFSAHVSHQLRTPLTGLLLGLESGLGGGDPRQVIRTALERGEHLQEIIDDLVRLSRGGEGGRTPLDVRHLLDEVRSRADVTVEMQDDLPEVRVSQAAVRQIVHVLVDNAATHGAPPITVSAVDVGTGMAIEVADAGPGIPEGLDVFRAPADGHGIGLALARSLAEAEGGRLVLRSTSPPVFSLLLPAQSQRVD